MSQSQVSRWSKYLEPPEEVEVEEEQNVMMDRQPFHSNSMTDRKRKWSSRPEESKHSSLDSVRTPATSPPNKKSIPSPILSTGPVSRWAGFLTSDCKEGKRLNVGGVTDHSYSDTISRHHVSSMFESRDDFSVDDEFLTGARL